MTTTRELCRVLATALNVPGVERCKAVARKGSLDIEVVRERVEIDRNQ